MSEIVLKEYYGEDGWHLGRQCVDREELLRPTVAVPGRTLIEQIATDTGDKLGYRAFLPKLAEAAQKDPALKQAMETAGMDVASLAVLDVQ